MAHESVEADCGAIIRPGFGLVVTAFDGASTRAVEVFEMSTRAKQALSLLRTSGSLPDVS